MKVFDPITKLCLATNIRKRTITKENIKFENSIEDKYRTDEDCSEPTK
jgi:hypothetical protein